MLSFAYNERKAAQAAACLVKSETNGGPAQPGMVQ